VADATSEVDALEHFGGLAGSLTGEHIPLASGDFVYSIRKALGVCGRIGPWNYPMCISWIQVRTKWPTYGSFHTNSQIHVD
jgi:betaine-aldehyde dehydrogenase